MTTQSRSLFMASAGCSRATNTSAQFDSFVLSRPLYGIAAAAAAAASSRLLLVVVADGGG